MLHILNFWESFLIKQNLKNRTTEVSLKDTKSFGRLYKINRYLHVTILKTLYISLIRPYLSNYIEA